MANRECRECGFETSRRVCPECDGQTEDPDVLDFFERGDRGAVILDVKGESQYQGPIRAAKKREESRVVSVRLLCEPTNPHDPNAVQVVDAPTGSVFGYLSRRPAKQFNKIVSATDGAIYDAVIAGGGAGRSYGVWIDATPLRAAYDAGRPATKRKVAAPEPPPLPTIKAPEPSPAPIVQAPRTLSASAVVITVAILAAITLVALSLST